jgi:hypothetical protein
LAKYLNQGIGFDEVRWATTRKTSYDARISFLGTPKKELLFSGTRLYRLLHLPNGRYFDGVWWMPKDVFNEIHHEANQATHGSGPLFRNYVAQYLALPSGSFQLCVVEIELVQHVYAWTGSSAPLFGRPGGVQQVFLPNLAERGDARTSSYARILTTFWLKF